MSTNDITILVEDPGAANLVLGVPDALAEKGVTAKLHATGEACAYLRARGEDFTEAAPTPDLTGTRLLAIGTSEQADSIAFGWLAAAREAGIETLGLVDSPANAETRFRGKTGDPLHHAPDRLSVTDAASRDAYAALGFEAEAIDIAVNPARMRAFETGTVLTEDTRATRRVELFGDDAGPVVLFLSELSDGLDPAAFRRSGDYSLAGRGGSDARTHIVLESLLDAAAGLSPKPRIFVRLHPKEPDDSHNHLTGELAGVNRAGDPLDACAAADLVVGMTTTLLAEARHHGQRILSVLPRNSERAWLADIADGEIACVTNNDAIAPALKDLLSAPRPEPVRPEGMSMADALLNALPADAPHRAAAAQ